MVLLETEVQITQKIKREINPVGDSKSAFIIREVLSYLSDEGFTEDNRGEEEWIQKAKWLYIVHSQEGFYSKMDEIVKTRKQEGWKLAKGEDSERYTQYTNNVGNKSLRLEYHWSEEQIIE